MSYVNCFLFPVAFASRLVDKVLPGDQDASQLRDVPPALNRLLTAVLELEASIIRAARLPFGLSLLAVAARRAS